MHRYLELEITLNYTKPRVWRRIQVRESYNFQELHEAIQSAFAWEDAHLWQFSTLEDRYPEPFTGNLGGPVPWDDDLPELPPPAKVQIAEYFKQPGDRCLYTYDFGDDWTHLIVLKQFVEDEARFERRLVKGRRSAPPEDCGSYPGFERLIEFVETGVDPYGDDPEHLQEWLGDWAPNAFQVKAHKRVFDQ